MKKFLLTATMLVGFVAIAQAQQGRVGINTTTPAATLDVVGTPADATKPDALLVPRLTRGQLQAKDAVYTSVQNGALAFVSSIADGAATGKAINVTAVGFYYYDGATTNTWIAVGGGGTPVTGPTFRTIASGSTAAILATDVGNCVILNATTLSTVTLPTPTPAMSGKTIKIFETSGGVSPTISSTDYKSTGAGIIVNSTGISLITDGISWFSDSLQ
ncbi:hypothetical protein GCM10023210_08090 [Chryseobacterium ginsengisoli]|uniref:Uncharacterized protein n=1 Tax=Chryseobacterium ginsengisoli TaxID=363853 RepID=A0ABP9LZH2_9FLAO